MLKMLKFSKLINDILGIISNTELNNIRVARDLNK